MTFIQRTLDLLQNSGKKQRELAEFAGISERTISTWKERGTDPPAKYAPSIADFFGVSLDYLLTGEDKKIANMKIGNIKANNGVIGVNAPATITINNGEHTTKELSREAFDLLKIFESLDTRERMKILNLAFELEENK